MILHKAGNRTVISCLTLFGKKAGRKLFHPKVIANTLTANSFSLAGFIGAVAVLKIFFFVRALHHFPPPLKIYGCRSGRGWARYSIKLQKFSLRVSLMVFSGEIIFGSAHPTQAYSSSGLEVSRLKRILCPSHFFSPSSNSSQEPERKSSAFK